MATATKKNKGKPPENVWFRAGQGSRFTDEDAQKLGPVLAGLVKSNQGELSAADIVHEAENKKSVLHEYIFAEDDSTAAFRYREELARSMVRSIYVCWENNETGEAIEESTRLLQWVVVSAEPEEEEPESVDEIRPGRRGPSDRRTRRLVTIDEVVGNKEYVDQMIANALADFKKFSARYKWFNENLPKFKKKFKKAFAAIEKL